MDVDFYFMAVSNVISTAATDALTQGTTIDSVIVLLRAYEGYKQHLAPCVGSISVKISTT